MAAKSSSAGTVVLSTEMEQKAEVLHKALSGLGTKDNDVIDVLTKAPTEKRQAIAAAYKALYKTDLLLDLKSDTSGDFWKVLKTLLRPSELNDAKALKRALKGLGTDEDTILEVLCTRSNEELNKISNIYFSLFRTTLISDLKKDTSGTFFELLLALLAANRDESSKLNLIQAKSDAEALVKALKKWSTDVGVFIGIFTSRNFAQLRETIREFAKQSDTDIETAIRREMNGDLAKSFLTFMRLIQNKEEYFAERLHNAVKGLGTADEALIGILVYRMDTDLGAIDRAYQKLYGQSLAEVVSAETSGDYRRMLLAILDNAGDARSVASPVAVASKYPPDIEQAADTIKNALSGLGTKEKDIIDVLTRSSAETRQTIAAAYKSKFKTDLLLDLKSDTSGDFWKVLKVLCTSPEVNDAKTLHDALKGLGTDEQALLEVLCTRSNEELNKASNVYFSLFRTTLVSDLKKDTSGAFLEVLLALLAANRNEADGLDSEQAKNDANALINAGPKKWGTDVQTFTSIFATRSFAQLQETLREFEQQTGKTIGAVVKSEMSGDLALSFLTLVRLSQSKEEYFAERLHQAVKGRGTADDTLIRILVHSMEKNLRGIDRAYEKLYGKTLATVVAEETSSDYKATLLAILEHASR